MMHSLTFSVCVFGTAAQAYKMQKVDADLFFRYRDLAFFMRKYGNFHLGLWVASHAVFSCCDIPRHEPPLVFDAIHTGLHGCGALKLLGAPLPWRARSLQVHPQNVAERCFAILAPKLHLIQESSPRFGSICETYTSCSEVLIAGLVLFSSFISSITARI